MIDFSKEEKAKRTPNDPGHFYFLHGSEVFLELH